MNCTNDGGVAASLAIASGGSAWLQLVAGRLLFGYFPLDFPLDLKVAQTAEKA